MNVRKVNAKVETAHLSLGKLFIFFKGVRLSEF